MPRINNQSQLERAMKNLQDVFLEQQNTDVSISRGKFNDWADSYGNKTLLFQSLYTKGIPINDLAKWLSPTQNQGQVRNAVVKINDIEYVRGVMGRYGDVDTFKKILNYDTTQNNLSIANAYAGSIRYWWSRQGGGNQQRVPRLTRTTRTTTPTEPTTTNGGTTEITEGVLNSVYQIIKSFHSGIQWWLGNSMLTDPVELRVSWKRYLNQGLLSPNYALLVNPSSTDIARNLLFWSSRNDQTKILLQRMASILLFDLNNFTRLATTSILETPNNFTEQFLDRFGRQNTYTALTQALETKHPSFAERVKFASREDSLLQKIYRGRNSSTARTTTTATTTASASETAATTLIRNIPFENTTFGIEIEYYYTPPSVVIRECKKLGIKAIELTSDIHEVVPDAWKVVTDYSVTDRITNGKEFVSPILKGKKGLVQMRTALNAMANAGALMHQLCGMHLHFGAKDLTLQQWKNLLFNYDGFQDLIDKLCPVYRRSSNRWSKRLSSIPNFRNQVNAAASFRDLQLIFLRAAGESTTASVWDDYRSTARYYAVNLMAYGKQGTVEFRQYGANIEVDSITGWVLFMHYIFEVSKKRVLTNFSFENVQNLVPVALSTWIANRIFDLSDPTRSIVSDRPNFEDRN
jgi:hypothetical protein